MRLTLALSFCTSIFLLSSCAGIDAQRKETKSVSLIKPDLTPVAFHDIPAWEKDNHLEALKVFSLSCARIIKANPAKEFGLDTRLEDWQRVCRAMPSLPATNTNARHFFETYFVPYSAQAEGKDTGLFTGYYEAALKGSLTRQGVYTIPLRARPDDLVMVNLGEFRPELKGQRIAGRVVAGHLKPYEDRAKIEDGNLPPAMDKPLLWVDSAVDAFFLQIQGSGVVTLPDGRTQRVGYDGQNGHPYTAIGKELVTRGALKKDNVTMQSIREWLAANPDEAKDVMRTNKSYVFFKKLDTNGPVGGEGVVLTPERSLAMDRSIWPYGLPVFLSAEHPSGNTSMPIQRLMVAQDTGGAIRGPLRGDFFWGYGDDAAHNAGLMQSKGMIWILLPRKMP